MEIQKLTGNESVMPIAYEEEYGDYGRKQLITKSGLTIRQHLAAMAMQGIVSNHLMIDTENWEWLAKASVAAADALINELNKKP